ncbi:MAG: methyltransferase domain-containing protein [Ignavibacteriales bacterium]|nr:methyltransferase domain-containing protein [Ignavibacteriales bacterium]
MDATQKKKVIPFVEYYLNLFALPGQRILDVGCGTAQYRHSTKAAYVGLDYTNDPFPDGFARDVDIVAFASSIPEPDQSFDLIFAVGAFYQFPERDGALEEFYRLLKVGGRVLLFDYNRRTQKRLEASEAEQRPCWTQWELRSIVAAAGFKDCDLLVPRVCHEVNRGERFLRLVAEEAFGMWAIVTGVR